MRIQQRGFRTGRMFTASARAFGYRSLRNLTNSSPMPQMDSLTLGTPSPPLSRSASSTPESPPPKIGSAILHRTPWTPPTAVRASGINIELEDGSQVIDAIGGAAVSCLGMGNQRVMDAITTQLGNLTCRSIHALIPTRCREQSRVVPLPIALRCPSGISEHGNVVSLCSFAENLPLHNLYILLN